MPNRVEGVSPAVLKWARESAGRSLEDVAGILKKKPEDIAAWEDGRERPTYIQLQTLAYRVYKRPLALLFFPEPPAEPPLSSSFRTRLKASWTRCLQIRAWP